MKKTTKVLRTVLLLVGVVLFVLATAGESIERSSWNAISPYVDDLAVEAGFESFEAIDDEAARDSVHDQALLLAAQETAAINRGYKKFSKVKDCLLSTSAAVIPDYADDPSVLWHSSDETVATVDASGLVRAVAPGRCDLVAASVNGRSDACALTVE